MICSSVNTRSSLIGCFTCCATKGTIITNAWHVNSAKYIDSDFLKAPLVCCCFDILVLSMTGLKTVTKRERSAFTRMSEDPAKKTQALSNYSYVCNPSSCLLLMIARSFPKKPLISGSSP